MDPNAEQLAEKVDLAYDFVETLHQQVIALIKDVERQLNQAHGIRCLQPRGYGYYTNSLSTSLAQPHAQIADYFAVCLRAFEGGVEITPFDGDVPPIFFLKVVLREVGLEHPEVRFGVLTEVRQRVGRSEEKFGDVAHMLTERALGGPAWWSRGEVERDYEDAYVSLQLRGRGVRLAEVPDSEAVAERVVGPMMGMVAGGSAPR